MNYEKELKFSESAESTIRQAHYFEELGATIRYNDEKNISEGDRLKMVRTNNEIIGYATVKETVISQLWAAIAEIQVRGNIAYGINHSIQLKKEMNRYYDSDIEALTNVKIIIYKVIQLA